MKILFRLNKQTITADVRQMIAAKSKNYLRAQFVDEGGDWQDPITAIFNEYTVLLDENRECMVPWEVLQNPGTVEVSAFCGDLHTATVASFQVSPSGYKEGETPKDPTPEVYDQLIKAVREAVDTANSVREDADAGEFDGERGPIGPTGETGPVGPKGEKGDTGSQGPQGVPGTAATVTIGTVTESEPGGDASVTNSGTATEAVLDFVIPRGETGPTGATGATGPAGLGVPQPTAGDAGKIPVVNADGTGYELGNPAPEVDDTLSISGAPADAAATGQAIEAVSPDDESVGAKPWSSKQIIDILCPPLEVTGNPVQCYPVAGYPLGVKASWEPRQEGTGDPSPENVRPITGLDEVTVTLSDGVSDGTTATLSLPSTVYGGEVDLATGEGAKTYEYMILDGTESWVLYDTGAENFEAFRISVSNTISSSDEGTEVLSNTFKTLSPPTGYSLPIKSIMSFASGNIVIQIDSETASSLQEFKDYLASLAAAGTPVTIAYKLATPQSLTATGSQSLPALSGENVLITNADSLTVTGRADPVQTINALNDRIAALESAQTNI